MTFTDMGDPGKKDEKEEPKDTSSGPKGILKASSNVSTTERSRKTARWDEENIQETYHPADKDYGHMVIEEPKTPFERSSLAVEELDPRDLATRLEEFTEERFSEVSGGLSPEDPLSAEERERRREFESRRKAHYNEFLMVQRTKEEGLEEEEEEDCDAAAPPTRSKKKCMPRK